MEIFDRIDPLALERRQWHLWLLALTVMLVLAMGMALLMYPAVFSNPVVVTGPVQRKCFFGFCTLAILLMGYLVDRQIEVSHLRKQLEEEQQAIVRLRQEASKDLVASMPVFEQFQDSLVMEYRRAANTNQPLSLVGVLLRPSRNFADPTEVSTAYGDAAKALLRKLRGEDSIYNMKQGVFGIILPGVDTTGAFRVVERLKEGLQDSAGASGRFTYDLRVVNYPEHAGSARELQDAVRSFLPWTATPTTPAELSAVPKSAP